MNSPYTPPRRFFGMRLLWTARVWRRAVDKVLAEHGLSEATALPLTVLYRLGDGVRQGVLADRVGVEGPSLVRLLDQLQATGLIERQEDPADRRAKIIYLTEAGRARAELVESLLPPVREVLLNGTTDADIEAAMRIFDKVEMAVSGREGE